MLRPPEAVADDVRAGLLDTAQAVALYGVAVDPATFAIDAEATRRLRAP